MKRFFTLLVLTTLLTACSIDVPFVPLI
ncbi:lipoprotein [Testudinibacter sp. P80/BLE/0925]